MNKIKEQYLLTFKFIGSELKNLIILNGLAYVACAVITYVIAYNSIPVKQLEESLGGTVEIESFTKFDFFREILTNNLKFSVLAFFLGFLLLGYAGAITLIISNGMVLGKAIAVFKNTPISPIRLIVFGILPHGIFELFGMFLTFSLSVYMTSKIIDKLYYRRNFKKTEELKQGVKDVVRTFILVVIPIVFIAAAIEGYITPDLLEAFL